MDPNATIKELRDLCSLPTSISPETQQRIFDAFNTLDEWLSRGGYLPDDWMRHEQ